MKNNIVLQIKKIFILSVICSIMIFSFGGCGGGEGNSSGINVVTVSYAQYDFARNITGGCAQVTMLSKPGADVHGYEPSLEDIKKIADADVFIYNGGESDKWIEKIFDGTDNLKMRQIKLCDYVNLLCSDHNYEDLDTHHHDEHAHFDEHIQSSPKNAVYMVRAICDALVSADPEHEGVYKENTLKYISELKKIDEEFERITGSSENSLIVVADRFPFVYMAHHYDLEYKALFAGCSQENDANPSVMVDMIETVRKNNIDTVFYTELSDGQMAETICRESGASKLMLYSCETISKDDFESGVTYIDLMKKNISNLEEALN